MSTKTNILTFTSGKIINHIFGPWYVLQLVSKSGGITSNWGPTVNHCYGKRKAVLAFWVLQQDINAKNHCRCRQNFTDSEASGTCWVVKTSHAQMLEKHLLVEEPNFLLFPAKNPPKPWEVYIVQLSYKECPRIRWDIFQAHPKPFICFFQHFRKSSCTLYSKITRTFYFDVRDQPHILISHKSFVIIAGTWK